MNGEQNERLLRGLEAPPYVIGDLQIISLGNFSVGAFSSFLGVVILCSLLLLLHVFLLSRGAVRMTF